jgi:hypothetical protein
MPSNVGVLQQAFDGRRQCTYIARADQQTRTLVDDHFWHGTDRSRYHRPPGRERLEDG